MVLAGLASSNSDARRKIKGGAVKIDGELVSDIKAVMPADECILKVGRKLKRIILSPDK